MKVVAVLDNGPSAGLKVEVNEDALELDVAGVRYVLHYTDKRDVRHFYMPTEASRGVA